MTIELPDQEPIDVCRPANDTSTEFMLPEDQAIAELVAEKHWPQPITVDQLSDLLEPENGRGDIVDAYNELVDIIHRQRSLLAANQDDLDYMEAVKTQNEGLQQEVQSLKSHRHNERMETERLRKTVVAMVQEDLGV